VFREPTGAQEVHLLLGWVVGLRDEACDADVGKSAEGVQQVHLKQLAYRCVHAPSVRSQNPGKRRITEMNSVRLVLFDMNNRISGPFF
jgi:hypothetical protein